LKTEPLAIFILPKTKMVHGALYLYFTQLLLTLY